MKMSEPLRNQLTTPKERAVFWTEYVVRHKGAPHLKCPAAQLSWVEFLMLDVMGVLVVAILAVVSAVCFCVRVVLDALRAAAAAHTVKKKVQ